METQKRPLHKQTPPVHVGSRRRLPCFLSQSLNSLLPSTLKRRPSQGNPSNPSISTLNQPHFHILFPHFIPTFRCSLCVRRRLGSTLYTQTLEPVGLPPGSASPPKRLRPSHFFRSETFSSVCKSLQRRVVATRGGRVARAVGEVPSLFFQNTTVRGGQRQPLEHRRSDCFPNKLHLLQRRKKF